MTCLDVMIHYPQVGACWGRWGSEDGGWGEAGGGEEEEREWERWQEQGGGRGRERETTAVS